MTQAAHHPTDVFEGEVIDRNAGAMSVVEQATRGEIDIQIATAKRFPRSIKQFMDDTRSLVTMNEEVAASCIYAIPRDGKTVEGPSARMAESVASCWGHMRAGSFIVGEDDRFITVRGFAWDMQRNVAAFFDIKRRITKRDGKKYNDDMIAVTAAAAGSIAYRNAVLKVVPAAVWRPLYLEARKVAVGDVQTLANRRAAAMEALQKIGVTAERVFAALQVKGVDDIDLEKLATLRGLYTSVRDEGVDVDTAFPDPKAQAAPSSTDKLKEAAGVKAEADPKPDDQKTEPSSPPAGKPGGKKA